MVSYPPNGFKYPPNGAFEFPNEDISKLFNNQLSKNGLHKSLSQRLKTKTKERPIEGPDRVVMGYGMPLEVPRGLVDFGTKQTQFIQVVLRQSISG